nr:uncharacterized protein LOC111511861 [Leptinotarsa decemlineata]
MWSRQIFVAILLVTWEWQQVAAVVNNGQPSEVEESKEISPDKSHDDKPTDNGVDSVAAGTDEKANRREAPLSLGDTYGAPAVVPSDSYLPSGPSSNLPVPVYGVPDAPTNHIIYPQPPPDIPPPVSLPSSSYGAPLSGIYGAPLSNNYLPPPSGLSNLKFEDPLLTAPKYLGPGPGRMKPVYGPPRFQYGPPGKPLFNHKFSSKPPFKYFGGPKYPKPSGTYGPPSGYFKNNLSFTKFNTKFNGGNFLSHTQSEHHGHSSHSSVSGHSDYSGHSGTSGISTHYGVPSPGVQTHLTNVDVSNLIGNGVNNQYGVPNLGLPNTGLHSIPNQYGIPDGDILGPPKPHYGPPQPSPHPKPPHPGAPAPPTPPDIKYDGWQPIPGLVSRVPTSSYGVPPSDNHIENDVSYHNDLVPPAIGNNLEHQTIQHESVGNLALETSYGTPHQGARDSYRAPLNTVTGSGAVIIASGEEAHGNHVHHHAHHTDNANNIDILSSTSGLGQEVQAVKSIGYEIFPSSSGTISNGLGQNNEAYKTQISHSGNRQYAGPHSQSNTGTFGFSANEISSHDFHNFHKSHKHKGLSFSTSGVGLIPPSGVYGVPPSGQYGTPLFTGPIHGFSHNAPKLNPPKHPILYREPVPSGIFDSITKQTAHKYRGHSSQSTYLSPPVPDIPNPTKEYGIPPPSSLYSLPKTHSAVSFQNNNNGFASTGFKYNVDAGSSSLISSYGPSLNIIESSYNLPTGAHSVGYDVIGLDQSHPGVTIDFTQGHVPQSDSYSIPHDCSLKSQNLPPLSYGVPSASSYTASLSTLTTNIGGSNSGSSTNIAGSYSGSSTSKKGSYSSSGGSFSGSTYRNAEPLPVPQSQIGYEVSEPKPHETYGVPDSSGSHSQKISSEVKTNLIGEESQGKSYGKSVAESFGASSELIQSQSIDFNNIPLQGALGSYTLQIQSADGSQNEVPHGQVLNDGLLQSILAAIEQPSKGESLAGQPIIQFQKSLEQQNFVTNDTISSVVEKLADAEIRHSTQLAKDEIEKSSELTDSEIQHSSPHQHFVKSTSTELEDSGNSQDGSDVDNVDETTIPLLEDNGIALYFSNNQRSKKETSEEGNLGKNDMKGESTHNSH